ncbi:azurin [Dokdonella sp.]|uniref:azurin n=1 Tax=Dokdonella sp. TaxID=2291710 RepID=UPI0027BA6561|nr:azurin [Dokdonella sp.]
MRKLLAVAVLALFASPLLAAECATTIEGNDMMQFNLKTITVPKSCTSFEVTLKHVGKLPVTAMGHNWVLSKASDENGVVMDGAKAGAAAGYEKPGDTRIIAATTLIGGGETASTKIDVAKLAAGEKYAYFCTFPGHATMMKGTLTLGE